MPIDDRRTHAAARKLVGEHQTGRSGTYDQNVDIHQQSPRTVRRRSMWLRITQWLHCMTGSSVASFDAASMSSFRLCALPAGRAARLRHQLSAVDLDDLPRDETRQGVGREIQKSACALVGGAETIHRNRRLKRLEHRRRRIAFVKWRDDDT